MAAQDLLQYKRKLKRPYLRRWYHGKGDDTYSQVLATKRKLQLAQKAKGDIVVAHRGKEYGVKEFIKKHPKYRIQKKRRR